MELVRLLQIYKDQGCQKIFVKSLSPNDNSKNQVYLGGNFEILNIFPISNIRGEESGNWVRNRFKADFPLSWISEDGTPYPAPGTQLVLYPKYPEVRLSGFLKNCSVAPSALMTQRTAGRLLFLGISKKGIVLGFVTSRDSLLASDFHNLEILEKFGVFSVINIDRPIDNRESLLDEMKRIHDLGWIPSKRLGSGGQILPCHAPNCGGYTLEAELGITPNGYSEPDYLGWEIKQFNTLYWNNISTAIITLMTPEPTGGVYNEKGVEYFLRKYGYADRMGRIDRINFGGVHRVGHRHPLTGLKMELTGFDAESGKIVNPNGAIALVDQLDTVTASWSFSSLLSHWNRKHNQACYVPSQHATEPEFRYRYADRLLLGQGTDFILYLKQMFEGNIYYDPGIKMEEASSAKPKIKRRSQFRIKSGNLQTLYKKSEIVLLVE
jgi:hypothetical protein